MYSKNQQPNNTIIDEQSNQIAAAFYQLKKDADKFFATYSLENKLSEALKNFSKRNSSINSILYDEIRELNLLRDRIIILKNKISNYTSFYYHTNFLDYKKNPMNNTSDIYRKLIHDFSDLHSKSDSENLHSDEQMLLFYQHLFADCIQLEQRLNVEYESLVKTYKGELTRNITCYNLPETLEQ